MGQYVDLEFRAICIKRVVDNLLLKISFKSSSRCRAVGSSSSRIFSLEGIGNARMRSNRGPTSRASGANISLNLEAAAGPSQGFTIRIQSATIESRAVVLRGVATIDAEKPPWHVIHESKNYER